MTLQDRVQRNAENASRLLAVELVIEGDVLDAIAAFKKAIDFVQVRLEDLRVVLQLARFD